MTDYPAKIAQERFDDMPNARQLLALVKSHVKGDDERFYSLVLQLAADEAKRGHAIVHQFFEGF